MLQHLSGGQWGMVGRRMFEAGSRMLPVVALLFVPLLFGCRSCSCGRVRKRSPANHVVQMKLAYLNVNFFIIRAVVYFVFWLAVHVCC